jgi:L-rhamnose mutarotase
MTGELLRSQVRHERHVEERPALGTHLIVAKRTQLRDGLGPEYDDVHSEIPHDLRDALLAAGVRQWHIWRNGNELIHVIDVEDRELMKQVMANDPANEAWQKHIAPLLDPDQSQADGGSDLPLVWSLA